MRIRTQLFVGTATLVLALVGTGWWLQIRQLRALERELGEVAATVGVHLLQGGRLEDLPPPPAFFWSATASMEASSEDKQQGALPIPSPGTKVLSKRVFVYGTDGVAKHDFYFDSEAKGVPPETRFEVRVESAADENGPRMLVIKGPPGAERRVPIPVEDSSRIVSSTLHQGLIASGLLLLAGMAAAALVAHRLSAPLRRLASSAEAIGRGELGTRVDANAPGELGDLLAAFNQMSGRLTELESEKAAWRAREHLAELGDLARGLGHTLRNPLHTLGLAVEELSSRAGTGGDELGATARGQIRRIDNWLRSFLSIGAGRSAAPERVDLIDLARDVALEAVQQGALVELEDPDRPLPVVAVAPALRSALSNLVGNALEASPAGLPVTISLSCDGLHAWIQVADAGTGLPQEVRSRLYSPHVTTKTGGSGMGLFLARQLIEGGHGGTLEISDRPGGGTLATVKLPLAPPEAG